VAPPEAEKVLIDNRTDLPDHVVEEAVMEHFVEHGSVVGARSNFQTYATEGSLLARRKFTTPRDVFDEIMLARQLADGDDDVAATMGSMIAVAFSEGMQNLHEDKPTRTVFDKAAKQMKLDMLMKKFYREYLISGSLTTVHLFQRVSVNGERITAPRVGVLLAERVRVVGSDIFGTPRIAYLPEGQLAEFLQEYFADKTTPARRAELARLDPVSATLFTGPTDVYTSPDNWISEPTRAYLLNDAMVARTSMPGDGPYPHPPLARNFALLEAKRLLNLMDYALLQGGMNFIVVAKKGDKDRPATPEEVTNLTTVIRQATRTGVIVGDHRLQFDIVTPNLTELLNPAKRQLLGRKIAQGLLRIPEQDQSNTAEAQTETELFSRVIASDRNDLRRHVEDEIYEAILARNRKLNATDPPRLWFPKIILQGTQYFTDYILKMRDRGDIPRRYAVEAGGFDYDAAVQQRKEEKPDDRIMTPAAVPFSSPNAGPQDNGPGRPAGSSSGNGANNPPGPPANARPRQVIGRTAGETVTAMLVGDEETIRVGELTYAVLEQYADTKTIGRITAFERAALQSDEPSNDGPSTVIPVNVGEELSDFKAVRLAQGLSMVVGNRDDGAIMARALCFREPEYSPLDAEETALRWGFVGPGED